MRRVTCRCHCSTCGGHFSSTAAFDAHRAGDHGAGDRHCLEPLDDERFVALSENGACSMYADEKVGITTWTLADDLQRARQRSGGSRRRPPMPDSTGRPHEPREAGIAA